MNIDTRTDPAAQGDILPSASLRMLFSRALQVVLKRWVLFMVVFFAVFAGGLSFVLTRPPIYVSKSTVMFEQVGKNSGDLATSYLNLSPVLSSVPLDEFFKSVVNSVIYRDQLAATLKESGYTPPEGMTIETAILRNLEYSFMKSSAFADIIARETDAKRARLMVKSALETLIERSRLIHREELRSTTDFLDTQLAVMTKNMEDVEREIQEFQEKNAIDPADVERGVWGELYDLQQQLVETEVTLSLEALNYQSFGDQFTRLAMETARDLGGREAPMVEELKERIIDLQRRIDVLLKQDPHSPQVDLLRGELGAARDSLLTTISEAQSGEPKLRQERSALLSALIDKRTESELNLVGLRNKQAFLRERIRVFKEDHPDILETALRFSKLIRSKEVLNNAFNMLMEKREEARIQAASETGGIKVIDPPNLPLKPEDEKKGFYAAVSLLLGLFLGFGVCFAADLFDDSFKTPEEVEHILRLSTLGMIPEIRLPRDKLKPEAGKISPGERKYRIQRSLLISNLPPSNPVVEAYRTLKTNIAFSFPDVNLKSITISSPQSGEGKSITSANLAISFAMSGLNTLLVDCDLRRPIQHSLFNTTSEPGLTDVLFEQNGWEKAPRPTGIENLTLMPVGSSTPNPADLISSEKMRRFIQRSTELYDIVIFDTPPITFAVDARLLANRTQGLILVIQNEKTRINTAKLSVNQVRQVGGRLIGTVINRISARPLYGSEYYIYGES
ncbi:MAG TPA: polysaccharide biosynthesis tyrosine autokinase [Bacteroidetes bacterium]|nr:polysaccharide biosynthesis tyrosine autokinase [Bacteroidota bacterium]